MTNTNNGIIMWILTFIILIGFLLIHKNLNNETLTGNKHEGLYLALFGLIASVYVGVKTSKSGVEGFTSLYRF